MHVFKLYTADILQDLQTMLKGVCPDVFIGNRPASVKESLKEFLVVSLPYSIRDKGAYQSTYYRIEIFVKTKAQGLQNIKRLDELSKAILAKFPCTRLNGRYIAKKPFLTLSGDDGLGYTVWNFQTSLHIITFDSYNESQTT